MIINIFLIIVIIAGTTGIAFCLNADKKNQNKKRHKPDSNHMPVAAILLLVITASTITVLVRSVNADVKDEQLVSEELFYSRVSGLVLGRYLARTFPNSDALIITLDKNSENTLLDAAMDGLREGLLGKVKIAAIDSPLPAASNVKSSDSGKNKISPERRLYLSRKMQSNNFDQAIARHPDCNLVISLIGLPKDANKMLILNLKPEKRPKLALLASNINMMKERISQGDISVAVINHPAYVPGKNKPPKDFESAFHKRFLLVTPDNVKLIDSEHPSVFN
jgi:hypothetical protein